MIRGPKLEWAEPSSSELGRIVVNFLEFMKQSDPRACQWSAQALVDLVCFAFPK